MEGLIQLQEMLRLEITSLQSCGCIQLQEGDAGPSVRLVWHACLARR
jgi:hypothetical protein